MLSHTVLIYAHTTAGLVAFVLGCLLLNSQMGRSSGLSDAYLLALLAMVVFLIAAVLVDWSGLSSVRRWVFGGLTLLLLYTAWRGVQARQVLRARPSKWHDAYVDHVGFTLISLFDGFVIVSALDLRAPGWLVAVVGVLAILIGRAIISRFKGDPLEGKRVT